MDAVYQAIDTAKREWAELMASSAVERGDAEVEHGKRDEILIRLVAALDPEFGQVVDDRERDTGYWYA